MTVKAKTEEKARETAPETEPAEESKAETKKSGAKKDTGAQVKAAEKTRDLTAEVVKAYGKLDVADLAKNSSMKVGEFLEATGSLPALKAAQVRSTRLDADGSIYAVTDNGQKLQVTDGECSILAGPGFVSEAHRPPVDEK